MKPSRFTIKVVLVTLAIALVARAAWRYTLWCRSMDFRDKAEVCTVKMNITLDELERTNETSVRSLTATEKFKHDALLRLVNYQERACERYERAARSPWRSVGPDEPPPAEP
jgi:hypothetical protein